MYTNGMARWLLNLFLLTTVLALSGAGAWYWQQDKEELVQVGEERLPGPLRGPINRPGENLTTAGILRETNRHRAINDLPSLQPNVTLDQAAQKKVADMFRRQYFAHVAPDGVGPADLVKAVRYEYIRVGENLALGNFASDADVVQAWMDSPGHRDNILHKGFTELGVAVGRGQFEGAQVWLAVQTFAAPLSSCPQVDAALQRQFDGQRAALDKLSAELATQQTELQGMQDTTKRLAREITELAAAGNKKIQEGNEQIAEGNRVYEETGDRSQAQPYWDRGEQLQNDGQALLEQAQQKQAELESHLADYEKKRTAFNASVASQREQHETINSLLSKLNQQIRSFNDCIK